MAWVLFRVNDRKTAKELLQHVLEAEPYQVYAAQMM